MLFLKLLTFLWSLFLLEKEGEGDDADDDTDPDAGSDDDTDTDDDDDEEIRDPKAKIKSLTEANERLARKNTRLEKKHKREIDDLQAQIDGLKKKKPAAKKEGDDSDDAPDPEERLKLERERDDLAGENAELNYRLTLLERDEIANLPAARRDLIARAIVPALLDSDEEDLEDAIEEALENLKKKDPGIFEPPKAKDDDDDDDDDDAPRVRRPKTGTGRRPGDKSKLDAAALAERFPNLKHRRVKVR